MNAALWGSFSALALGGADFVARFSSRAIGPANALFGTLLAGSIILSLWVWLTKHPMVWDVSGLWLLAINGVSTTIMTLLLYTALARGPVSVVAPIVASYPALVLMLAVLLGFSPSLAQWAAVALTIIGVLIVAGAATQYENDRGDRRELIGTIFLSILSCLFYAALVSSGQAAVPIYGDVQTLWMGRLISLASISLIIVFPAERRNLDRAWWPVLGAQGVLDAGGYLFLFAGSAEEDAAIAAVTGSTFGVVTTLLARFVLKERIALLQWAGIVLVFGGVAWLSAL
ncbi:MAG TPA: DMT family transporter [Alphaproteobacteria bacterium]|nr:DMT family transporter [Alphaproteobacteria bacterium]